jgi:hypothetical protein
LEFSLSDEYFSTITISASSDPTVPVAADPSLKKGTLAANRDVLWKLGREIDGLWGIQVKSNII